MSASLKSYQEIEAMRQGGLILAQIFDDLKKILRPGLSELEVNDWVAKSIRSHGAEATYLTEEVNFPAVICISVNDELVHSPPTEYCFKAGDLASFDLVITYRGMKVDSAFTTMIGAEASGDKKRLLDYTERSLYAGIEAIKPGAHIGDIGFAIESVLNSAKLGVIRDLVGHGIGRKMQEPPEIPNYGLRGTGPLIKPGDSLAIEPMATLGGEEVRTQGDGWTIKTADGSLSAHFEHTVLVGEDYLPEILTKQK